jgi:hypothetical protein
VLKWLPSLRSPVSTSSYSEALDADIYAEAVRFDQDWRKREPGLLPMEREYATQKLSRMGVKEFPFRSIKDPARKF